MGNTNLKASDLNPDNFQGKFFQTSPLFAAIESKPTPCLSCTLNLRKITRAC